MATAVFLGYMDGQGPRGETDTENISLKIVKLKR